MTYKEEKFNNTRTIVGISVRTSNIEGQGQENIGQLWNDFFVNNIKNLIPNKISDDVYCVYSDYESDFRGAYTTYLGCWVSQVTDLPEGLVVKEIPATKYFKFEVKGTIPDCIGDVWNHIWTNDYNRSYIADFDVYGQEAQNLEDAIVYTYLSIK